MGVFDHRRSYAGSGGPNQIINPGAENNAAFWAASGSASVDRTESEANTGDASFEITINGGAGQVSAQLDPSMLFERQYRIAFAHKADIGETHRVLAASALNETFVGTGDWETEEFTFTTATTSPLIVFTTDEGSAVTFYIDDVSLALTSLIQPHPIYQGQRVKFPPGPGRLAVKLRHGDSDAEPDVLGLDDRVRIRIWHRRAYTSLSEALEE